MLSMPCSGMEISILQGNASFECGQVIKFNEETLLLRKCTDVVEMIFSVVRKDAVASEQRPLFMCRKYWRAAMASSKYKSDQKKPELVLPRGPARKYSRKWLNWSMLPSLMGGIFNAILGLTVAVVFFYYGDEKIVPIVALQSKCHGFSDSHSVAAQRSALYASCIGQSILFSNSPAQTFVQ